MEQSNSIGALAAALAKAQGEIKAAQMNAVNPFLKNKYADLGDVIAAIRAPLASNGIAYTQFPTSAGASIGITTTLMHSSGEWMRDTIYLDMGEERGKSQAQVMGSIITYLRRYALASIAGVYADEDTDGNNPQPRAPQPRPEPRQTTPTQPHEDAPKQEHPAPTNGNGKYDATSFWLLASQLKIEKQSASKILNSHKNNIGGYDYKAAMQELETLQPA